MTTADAFIRGRIEARYFRKTIGKPDGAVCHMGDCTIFSSKVCTCGLLHDLLSLDFHIRQELYPNCDDEEFVQMTIISPKDMNLASLPTEELIEALASKDRCKNLFIAGKIDGDNLALWLVNGKSITVPLDIFKPSGDGTTPDFNDFAITDYGNTVRFGPYEAAGDAILYEANKGDVL